jgi:hypothetical protein
MLYGGIRMYNQRYRKKVILRVLKEEAEIRENPHYLIPL